MSSTQSLLRGAAAALILGLAACSSPDATGPSVPDTPQARRESAPRNEERRVQSISVMTRNMYIGADVDAVIAALASGDPAGAFAALGTAIQTLALTDYPTRARGIADEIARRRPDVVGLQEVSKIDITIPGAQPVDLHLDFLPVLMQELGRRHLPYVVAKQNHNFTVAPYGGAVSVADEDVMLVNPDRVEVLATMGGVFQANMPPIGGLAIQRGWVGIDARIGDERYTVVSTHPESGNNPGLSLLRAAQLDEIVTAIGTAPRALVIGDLNDGRGSPMYQVLQVGGFVDAWTSLRPGAEGLTCCHAADLSNPQAAFTQTLDYVFARGLGSSHPGLQGSIELVGLRPWERLAGPAFPIWPSDHAGVWAQLLIPPATADGH